MIVISISLSAAGSNQDAINPFYADENRDGINDLYTDINGDGRNDINGELMQEDILFTDLDEDGMNDDFADMDGDGVNDLYIVSNKLPVLDINGDGCNDITGYKFKKGDYGGYRYGYVVEECGRIIEDYEDRDGDYMDDHYMHQNRKQMHDKFIDEDNDGISDNRKNMYRKGKNKKNNNN